MMEKKSPRNKTKIALKSISMNLKKSIYKINNETGAQVCTIGFERKWFVFASSKRSEWLKTKWKELFGSVRNINISATRLVLIELIHPTSSFDTFESEFAGLVESFSPFYHDNGRKLLMMINPDQIEIDSLIEAYYDHGLTMMQSNQMIEESTLKRIGELYLVKGDAEIEYIFRTGIDIVLEINAPSGLEAYLYSVGSNSKVNEVVNSVFKGHIAGEENES